jgi:hypothetical protein
MSYGANEESISRVLSDRSARVVNVIEIEGYQDIDTREIFELSYEIRSIRARTATLRSDLQIDAEAEILQLIRKLDAEHISHQQKAWRLNGCTFSHRAEFWIESRLPRPFPGLPRLCIVTFRPYLGKTQIKIFLCKRPPHTMEAQCRAASPFSSCHHNRQEFQH